MGEPIKECWDTLQYHTGLAQITNVADTTLVKPAGLKVLYSFFKVKL